MRTFLLLVLLLSISMTRVNASGPVPLAAATTHTGTCTAPGGVYGSGADSGCLLLGPGQQINGVDMLMIQYNCAVDGKIKYFDNFACPGTPTYEASLLNTICLHDTINNQDRFNCCGAPGGTCPPISLK